MAQLIKLRDYISRYQTNPFHYPTQFIRLKQENWERLVEMWELEKESRVKEDVKDEESIIKERRFRWNPFSKKERPETETLQYERQLPETKKQLTLYFLNKLYPFQLKWATSTLSHVSFTDKKYNFDRQLIYFLQHFPDIYLIMYYPIFNIKKAPVDGEIIIISPVGIEIIHIIDDEPESTIVVNDDRTWLVESENHSKKILSPIISLKRTESIVNSILKKHNIQFSVQKTVLSKSLDFLYATTPYRTSLIGKKQYDLWYEEKRNLSSSLKGVQLKAMEALLQQCLSTSVRRPEWEEDDDENIVRPFMAGEK